MKEIGSSFYLDNSPGIDCSKAFIPLQLYGNNTEYFSSCRDALRVVLNIEKIESGCVVVPPFTCHAVIQPFLEHGLIIRPYSIRYDLTVDVEKTINIINTNNPVVFIYHPYFGFFDKGIEQLYDVLKGHNTVIIEDRTQNMFSMSGKTQADYVVGSIRKWLEIPDGGFLNSNKLITAHTCERFEELISISIEAMKTKYRYLVFNEGTDKVYREMFAKYEEILDDNHNIYTISNETQSICMGYDWDRLRTSRKENYEVLSNGLTGIEQICKVDQKNESSVVPFMLPVYVKRNRRELQAYLVSKKIFATAIWGCPEQLISQISDLERKVYAEILCFPIDQRYEKNDMERIVSCVKDYYEEK